MSSPATSPSCPSHPNGVPLSPRPILTQTNLITALLLFVLLLLISLALKITVWHKRLALFPSSSSSLENSYLFISPLQAKADGQEQIRVIVSILDSQGLAVANKPVSLLYPPNLLVRSLQPATNDLGQAIFDISSPRSGSYPLEAQADGLKVPQKIKLVFY